MNREAFSEKNAERPFEIRERTPGESNPAQLTSGGLSATAAAWRLTTGETLKAPRGRGYDERDRDDPL